MTLEEKIKLLKKDMQELNKELERAKTAFKTSADFSDLIANLDLNEPKNRETSMNIATKVLGNEITFLRVQIDIIRRISIETANYLDGEVTKYEKAARNFLTWVDAIYESQDSSTKATSSFQSVLSQLSNSYNRLHDMVRICKDSIRDTIKYLEPTNTNPTSTPT